MWFDSWEAVKQFAGEDAERASVPPNAREVLARFDERSQHYAVKERLECRQSTRVPGYLELLNSRHRDVVVVGRTVAPTVIYGALFVFVGVTVTIARVMG